jgi:hypothetical protein
MGRSTGRFGDGRRAAGGSVKGRKIRQPSKLLRDYRWVYNHPSSEAATPSQRILQTMLKDNPKEFLAQLGRLEQSQVTGAAKEQKPKEEKPKELVMDAGSERCETLLHKLLDEALEEAKKTPVVNGLCMTCHQPVPGGHELTSRQPNSRP